MLRYSCCAAALVAAAVPAFAQNTTIEMPPVTVEGKAGSLTVPTTVQARQELYQIPGAVDVVPDSDYKNGPAATIKDVLDYVPGVFVQPKWGDDSRISIRGSGLSRNYHLRSLSLYMDGIPINTADGYGDFQEIDPSAYRHIDVYKGANALEYGANSLGGAINFVTPSGRDAALAAGGLDIGSFGYNREQVSSGAVFGSADYFITLSNQSSDGFRDHADGDAKRGSANLGYQLTPDLETRFYLNGNTVRQRIPGEVSKSAALSSPKTAATTNVTNDWQRNIDTVRFANKTTLRLDTATIDLGLFGVNRHLMHPIFQWLDYNYEDFAGFLRATDQRDIGGHRNKATIGFTTIAGTLDNKQYVNSGGVKGALLSSSSDESENYIVYGEDAFYVVPTVAIVGGFQYLHAVRDRQDRFLSDGNQSGRTSFSLWSPKVGLLWDVDPKWQVFGNISRSAEVPSFGEGSITSSVPFTALKAQTATTYEIGTRGQRPGFMWNAALYRAEIENELQCSTQSFGVCDVLNIDQTVHQGIELGGGAQIGQSLLSPTDQVWFHPSYTFSDFRFDNNATFGDNQLPGAPRHYLRAELLYKHPSGLSIGPNVEWVPEGYFVDSANTLKTDPYAIFGVRGVLEFNEHLSAYIEGRNLGDKKYISSASVTDRANASDALFFPGDGRSVFAGIRATW